LLIIPLWQNSEGEDAEEYALPLTLKQKPGPTHFLTSMLTPVTNGISAPEAESNKAA
jgi:hypothetical protein